MGFPVPYAPNNSIQKPSVHLNHQANNNHRMNKSVQKPNSNNYHSKAQQQANQNAMEAMMRMHQHQSNPVQSVMNASRLLQMGSSQQSVELIQKYIAQNLAQQNNQRTQQMTYRQQQASAKLQLRKQLEKNSAGNSPSAAASARNQLSPFGHQQRVHLPRRPRTGRV